MAAGDAVTELIAAPREPGYALELSWNCGHVMLRRIPAEGREPFCPCPGCGCCEGAYERLVYLT